MEKEFIRFSSKKNYSKISDYFEFTVSKRTLEEMDDNPELMERFTDCLGEAMKILNCKKPLAVKELTASDIISEQALEKARDDDDEYDDDDDDDEYDNNKYINNDRENININITFDNEEVDDSPNHDNYGGYGSAERQERWKNFYFSNGRGRC